MSLLYTEAILISSRLATSSSCTPASSSAFAGCSTVVFHSCRVSIQSCWVRQCSFRSELQNVAATAAGSQRHQRSHRHPYRPRLCHHHRHRCHKRQVSHSVGNRHRAAGARAAAAQLISNVAVGARSCASSRNFVACLAQRQSSVSTAQRLGSAS